MADNRGTSLRERTELTVTALTPAALSLLPALAAWGGRLAWLGAVIALPVGLWLCSLWRTLGEEDLSRGLRRAFGPWIGGLFQALYLAWGLFLLAGSAQRYADRLMTTVQGEAVRWLFLGVGLALCLWLGRGDGAVLARTAKLIFLATLAVMGLTLILALPALDWRNLWPPAVGDWMGLPASVALTSSLAGYGIYALCLPGRQGDQMDTRPWAIGGCAALTLLIIIVVGAFGPVLTAQMAEPFLFLLQGVEVPGAFQRGEAALMAMLALADLLLLAMLAWGCKCLWRDLSRSRLQWVGEVLPAGAFLLAGVLTGGETGVWFAQAVAPIGNLIFGIGIPAFAVLTRKLRGTEREQPIFSGRKTGPKEDVGGK